MKDSFLRLIACPTCKGDLGLKSVSVDGENIMEGDLTCRSCSRTYPITRGVPRFVDEASYAESFGYEWRRFGKVQLDSANGTRQSETGFDRKTGLKAEDLHGRLILDAGVGAGRYAEVAANSGGEIVGVDLTGAVDVAFQNVGRRPRIHLAQADIFSLPFRSEIFDVVYSLGVLHHTPDTARAFEHVAATVKRGGQLAIYVYHAGGLARHFSDVIRVVTTRLPRPVLNLLSSLAGPLYPLYRIPVAGPVLQTVLPISLHPNWRWRWLDTFDWYSPRYQSKHTYPEVFGWFTAAGFTPRYVADEPICVRGVKR